MSESATRKGAPAATWVAVGLGYAVALTIVVLGFNSELPWTVDLPGAVARGAVAATPPTLAAFGLLGRPVLLLPAVLVALTSVPALSVFGLMMFAFGVVWLATYLQMRPAGGVMAKIGVTLVVWLLWAAAVVTLSVHIDPACVQSLTDGSVRSIDAKALGFESGWVWEVSSTTVSSSLLTPDVVMEACSSDITTGWEAAVALALVAGSLTSGWLLTRPASVPISP